jgi:2-polyprenyl-3-methyl-5-hydroxy-6-metoxy-1,4-benzoquinol methylase
MNNLKFWEFYKLMDKSLYLSEDRTMMEVDLIDTIFVKNEVKSFIDFGCGDGRITLPLVQKGYMGYGIDLDLDEINHAKRRSSDMVNIKFDNIDFLNFNSSETTYDAAIFVYSSFGYFNDSENQKLLNKVNKCINTGGIIFIDLLNKDWAISKSQGVKDLTQKVSTVTNDFKQVTRSRSPQKIDGLLYEITEFKVVRQDGSDEKYTYQQRLFSKKEIEELLTESGFEGFQYLGSYENEPYGVNSPRMILIAHKV